MAATASQPEIKIAKTPPMPVFQTVAEERLHRKQRLASAFRLFAKFGFSEGVAGHITARDPELHDHFWVNPFGMHFAHIRVSDLILVNEKGDVVEGNRPVNEAAFAIHSRLHMARPDVVAAAHAHSLYGKTWASLGRLLDPLTQDACAFYEDHALFDPFSGVVLSEGEGVKLAAALGNKKAAILQNHGILTVGATIEAAAWWYISMEDAARAQLLAEAAGTPKPIPHDVAKLTHSQVGTEQGGYYSFQPLWDWIVAEEPDLLD